MVESKIGVKINAFEVPSLAYELYDSEHYQAPQPAAAVPAGYPAVSAHNQVCSWSEPKLSPRQFKLSELDTNTLDHLCEQFRAEVFKRAGRIDAARELEK